MNAYRSRAQGLAPRLILLALVLRVAVPVGLMPAAIDGGWYLKLCPDGIPVAVASALFGHQHHHAEGADDSFVHCDLGGGYASAAPLDCAHGFVDYEGIARQPATASQVLLLVAGWQSPYRPRGPPTSHPT